MSICRTISRPGGALAVDDGDAVIGPVNRLAAGGFVRGCHTGLASARSRLVRGQRGHLAGALRAGQHGRGAAPRRGRQPNRRRRRHRLHRRARGLLGLRGHRARAAAARPRRRQGPRGRARARLLRQGDRARRQANRVRGGRAPRGHPAGRGRAGRRGAGGSGAGRGGRRRLSTDLEGKVALVTGGSRGIGAAICRRLAEEGCTIAVAYRSGAAEAEAVASEVSSVGGVARTFAADLGAVGRARAADRRGARGVRTHRCARRQPRGRDDVAAWRDRPRGVRSGDRGQPALPRCSSVQAALPGMRDRGFARILFMSSAAAFRGGPIGAHYAASKSGLHGMTHYLSAQLASEGITVNAIAPGFIDTEMLPGDPDELASWSPRGGSAGPRRSPIWRSRRWATRSSPTTWCSWTRGSHPR